MTLMILAAGVARAQTVSDTTRPNEVMTPLPPSDLNKLNMPREKSPGMRATYRDVESEFERLQLANKSLAGSFGQNAMTDYVFIRKEAAEVNKSASRLRAYLSFPKPVDAGTQKKVGVPLSQDGLRPAVASLDSLVRLFVWNPILHHSDVVDSEKSVKASRDLEEIINLSERIRKCAEGQLKNAGKR